MSAARDASLDAEPIGTALRHPLLTAGAERRLARRAAGGDVEARHELVRHNLRLAASLARAHAAPGVGVADLFQEGVIGLMRAADRYDLARGTRFSTYATWWVRAAISEAVRRLQPIPLPRGLELHRRRVAAAGASAEDGHECEGTIAGRTGLTPEEVRRARAGQELQRLAALDSPSSKAIEDRTVAPLEEVAWKSMRRQHAERLLASLGPLESCVLRMRFGFDDDVERTHREIAEQVGSNRESIRLLERRLIAELVDRPDAGALRDPSPEARSQRRDVDAGGGR